MKRIYYLIIVLIISLCITISVKSANIKTNIFSYSNTTKLCNAIKNNNEFKIGLYNYYDKKSYAMESSKKDCNNSTYYNNHKNEIKNGESYVSYYRGAYNNIIKIEDEVLKKASTNSDKYSYIVFSNKERDTTADNFATTTLKPYEKVYIKIDLSNKNIKSNTYRDLRIKLQYGNASGDIDIASNNTIGYYVYTKNSKNEEKTYGPYKLADTTFTSIYTMYNSEGKEPFKLKVYDIVSENLMAEIPKGVSITGVKIVPYDFYSTRGGFFKLFSMSMDGYSEKYTSEKGHVKVSNNDLRHNIVDNMMENATLKWDIKKESSRPETIVYRCRLCGSAQVKTTGNIIYGLPYVNTYDTTIQAFISQTTQNTKSTKNAYFSYKLANKYLADGTILDKNLNATEKNVKKGDLMKTDIGSTKKSTMYVYDSPPNENYNTKDSLTNLGHPYIANDGYYFGLDCSSSVFLAIGRVLPYSSTMANSAFYFRNSEVRLLGDIKFSMFDVEKYLRQKDKTGSLKEVHMSDELMKAYHDEYIRNGGVVGASNNKKKEVAQKIYAGYAELIPGDAVTTWGHVRMATGYPYIVCNDNKVINSTSKTKYSSSNNCSEHGGINDSKSYVITTEVGGRTQNKNYNCNYDKYCISEASGIGTSIKKDYTGWSYSFNKNITDITDIDEYFSKTNTSFRVNKKYTFKELYENDTIYLPFRYVELDKNNEVELPYAKLILKDTTDVNSVLYNYMKTKGKLKGTIITNYIIEEIKIEINKEKPYYIYPNQTNTFSLTSNITDASLLKTIKNLDYDGDLTFKISIKAGPTNIESVMNELKKNKKVDNDGYIKVVDINHKKTTSPKPTSTTILKPSPSPIQTLNPTPTIKTSPKTTTKPQPTTVYYRGDVNGDGKVSQVDYHMVIRHLINKQKLTGNELKRADVNNDGLVNPADTNTYGRIFTKKEDLTLMNK